MNIVFIVNFPNSILLTFSQFLRSRGKTITRDFSNLKRGKEKIKKIEPTNLKTHTHTQLYKFIFHNN